jgi:cytochrome P450
VTVTTNGDETIGSADRRLGELVATEAFRHNPYPGYHQFLEHPGWTTPSGYRVFSRYEDVMAILRQPAIFGQEGIPYPNFHVLNPPEHTRLRKLVATAFTPRAVARQRESIIRVVDDLVDRIADEGEMDLVKDFALHLPARVTADMLDVPVEDAQEWHRWLYAIGGFRGKVWYLGVDATDQEQLAAKEGATQAAEYFGELIAQRASTRGNDIVSALIAAREGEDQLSEEEVLFSLVLILGAGLHTTANQIANTFRALLEHPGSLDRVVADQSLVPNTVEEALRYDGTLQAEYRVTRTAALVGEVAMPAETPIIIVNAAANRDPAVFENPDAFDIDRGNAGQHLTFGWGIHRCLGAQLARLELQLATAALSSRLRGLRLTGGQLVQHPYDRWRGVLTLPVSWDEAA